MAETHVFKNLSGIEYEVGCMLGKHQRLISQKNNGISAGSLEKILADLIVRVGSETIKHYREEERIQFVKKLPSQDRIKALFEIQQFTNDFSKEFTFIYTYESQAEGSKGVIKEEEIEVSFERVTNETPYPQQATELKDFVWEHEGIFPVSGEKYGFRISDGNAEAEAGNDKNPSSHTPILMHYPKRLRTKNKQGQDLAEPIWIKIGSDDLDKMPIKDIEHLRRDIYGQEARYNTRIAFDHPEANLLPPGERRITIDIMQIPAFYFPSGTF